MTQDWKCTLEEFYRYLRFEKRLAQNTYESYVSDIEHWIDFIQESNKSVEEIIWSDIRTYFVQLSVANLSSASIQRKQSSIKQFFDFCVFKEIITHTPVRRFPKRKKAERLPVSLKEEETERLFEGLIQEKKDAKSLGNVLIMELLFQTGIRVSELINIHLSHIDWEEKTLKVLGKGNKWRVIPVMKELLHLITEYLASKELENWVISEYLLTLKAGDPLYRQYVYRVVKNYLSLYSREEYKGPHVLRHTFATQLLNAGADLLHIKELLGHEQLESTQIYTQVHIDRLKEIYKQSHPKS